MKKKFKNSKGFAMAELLAVSIGVLVLFTILFSNYLPLLAEFETRLSYNDVTAEYAAHYIRKAYYNTGSFNSNVIWVGAVRNGDFVTLYKSGDEESSDLCLNSKSPLQEKNCKQLNEIVSEYGVEEIILTSYSLKELKDNLNDSSSSLKENDPLYGYVKYLPNYSKKNERAKDRYGSDTELFRLIIKTKYGYATTALLSEYKTPDACNVSSSGKVINKEKCNKQLEDSGGVIKIPPETTEIGCSTDSEKGIYEDLTNLKRLDISGPVKKICKNAFKNTGLEYIIVGDGETAPTLAKNWLDNPNNNVTVIPSSVESIEDGAFSNIRTLKGVSLNSNIVYGNSVFSESGEDEGILLLVAGKTTSIADKMFYHSNMNEIDFTEASDLESINTSSFSQISADGNSIDGFGINKTVALDFSNATELKTINDSAFNGLKISSLKFNSNLKTIGDYAFNQMNSTTKNLNSISLSEIDLSDTKVTSIGKAAFAGIRTSSLKLNNGLQKIGAFSFRGSEDDPNNIVSLNIPSSVTSIGSSAFFNGIINTLTIPSDSNIISIGDDAFRSNNIGGDLYIPSSVGKRSFLTNSNDSGINLTFSDRCESIGESAFSDSNVKTMTIPNSVTTINNNAFQNNKKLSNVDIDPVNSLLTNIGQFAFQGCLGLEKFVIPKNVTSIGNRAFHSVGSSNSKFSVDNYSPNYCSIDTWCKGNTTSLYYFGSDYSSCNSNLEINNKGGVCS